jgi:putative ABC transport system substrate-binding protein
MRKRLVCLALCSLLVALGSPTDAQQGKKSPRIGLLISGSVSSNAARIEALRQGLRELGYVEGRNIVVEYRHSEDKLDRLPDLAAELARLKVDVIVTGSAQAVRAAKQATTTIPIVIAQVSDPVSLGLVASLARPGGNITGLSTFLAELNAKELELLGEAFPGISRVAFLTDSADPSYELVLKQLEATADLLRIKLQVFEAREPNDIDGAFSAIKKSHAEAVQVMSHPVFGAHRPRIAKLAVDHRLPTMFSQSEYVEAGGLMSYGVNIADLWRRAATYVDKILKGIKPGDIPIERPRKFEFIINLKTAKQIGLTIPPNVLARADRVIK